MPRILIAEDDLAIAVALEDDLRLEGYDVEVVNDGEAAIGAARAVAFDLIVLDLMLPRKDGFDVCRELRRFGSTPGSFCSPHGRPRRRRSWVSTSGPMTT